MTQEEAKKFVTAWQTSSNLDDVAKKLSRTIDLFDKGEIRNIAAHLRRQGVPLRRFTTRHRWRGPTITNYQELKCLAEKLA